MLEDENATLNGKSNSQQFSQAKTSASSDMKNNMIQEPVKIMKGVRAYCTNEPGKKKGDEEMLCIGNNQPTEEFPVEAKDGSMVHAAQIGTIQHCVSVAQPKKKTSQATFII